ncbi:MAG TPA: hypothetical protein VFK88_10210 [Gallionella sp.]|nr:hypothetical protein [Gallionella sp.]
MMIARADLSLLRWSLSALALTTGIAGVILYASTQYANQTLRELNSARLRHNDARSRLAAAGEDRNNLSANAGAYGALEQRRIIGDGDRLSWIEGLEHLRQQHLVTDFHYLISPQKNHARPTAVQGSFDIRYSEMKLQFELLHEGQLVDFLGALHNQVNGWYQLEGCSLHRIGADEAKAGAALTAECTGGWITLKNRGTP